MNKKGNGWYLAKEFAELTGVTVRTLHYYDHLGLLRPSGHTPAGYRQYSESDFARLQQIVTLKFIGFSLARIKDLLDRNSYNWVDALRRQREILTEKTRRLDMAVQAIGEAERGLASNDGPDWTVFVKIVEVINMQNDKEWMKKYYTEDQFKAFAEADPEAVTKGQQDWADLIKEVEAALDGDPAGDKAQALAARWARLVEGFTGGDPEIRKNLGKMYADQGNWPSHFKKPYSDEVGTFIRKAMAARDHKAGKK